MPGKTMPGMKVVTRRYPDVYQRFISLGSSFRLQGLAMHGIHYRSPMPMTSICSSRRSSISRLQLSVAA